MATTTWPAALTWRLGRQLLDPPAGSSVPHVVGALGAVAAQLEPTWAKLGLRTRMRESRTGDVERAVDTGTVVRTFAFRGAVHLMTPDLAAVHLALRTSSRMWERASWREFYRLEPGDWPDLVEAVRDALAPGPLTRDALADAVTAHARFAHLRDALTDPSVTFLKPLAWQGALCLGPVRDGALTLRSLATVPDWPGLPDLDDAGPRAVAAYLHAYGPASADHLVYWLSQGLGVRRALLPRWVDALGERVAHVEVDGDPLLVLREDLDGVAAATPRGTVRLVPRYDPWVLGPGTADEHVVPPALRPEVSRGAHVVLVDGAVAGTWARRGDDVTVTWAADGRRSDDTALDTEVERLGALVGADLRRVTA
ncbi:winged helix DNA-binding domain-containing protein [Cellulomonas iranensis]|uniref:DNA glycosylase AlkZ-like family protein n=1 Tax=Cellulomonas iranensis TaxID=76862 RepID=UPI001CF33D99|nr:crosslink repair DNA glycosylase YcaQ family protein [Cellulomonas iranensis]UCN16190.1 winged helix DNA-binding domain-containing protein [Cellulomonas iranensis]